MGLMTIVFVVTTLAVVYVVAIFTLLSPELKEELRKKKKVEEELESFIKGKTEKDNNE